MKNTTARRKVCTLSRQMIMRIKLYLFVCVSNTYCTAASRSLETHSSLEPNTKTNANDHGNDGRTVIEVSRAGQGTANTNSQATARARAKQGQLCRRRCNGPKMININARRCFRCVDCMCGPDCDKYGACCPQTGEPWRPPPIQRSQCRSDLSRAFGTRQVVTCDPDYPAGKTRDLCESKETFPKRDTLLPVTSAKTNVSFANVHCAKCNHDDENVIEWTFSCYHNQYFYHVVNDSQYADLAIQHPDLCHFSSLIKKRLILHHCAPDVELSRVISTCNVTERWSEADEDMREACEKADWTRGDIVSINNTRFYANAMCALCNGEAWALRRHSCGGQTSVLHRPTTGLIESQFSSEESVTTHSLTGCSEGQWKHPQVSKDFHFVCCCRVGYLYYVC